MRGYLLDTDHCIEILRRNSVVIDKAQSVATVPVWVSLITIGELFYGVQKSQPAHIAQRRRKLETFVNSIDLIVFDRLAAEQYGLLKAALSKTGQLISDNDLQIASIAVVNNLKLVTHNTAQFNRLISYGLQLEDWMV